MDFFGVSLDDVENALVSKETDENIPSTIPMKRHVFTGDVVNFVPKRRKFDAPTFRSQIICEEGCFHQVIMKPGVAFGELRPSAEEPAKSFPFKLDSFQRQAILCIENQQSVLVSAHTSAGKTVVAEYAIATCLKKKQRVIYTTPIKALSNQKFREFTEEFVDVGLMTGDVTINPDASVIIMTTEILRSMLYRGSDVTREMGWVIFDEVHYMRDKERGVIWEETIILIPDCVRMIFLSATIPNAHQFAEWIVYLHSHPCHVVYTDYRPTPLQHYVFPCGGDGIHLVVNQQREFIEENFSEAMDVLRKAGDNAQNDPRHVGRKGGSKLHKPYCAKLVKLVMDQELDPLIVFSFSKRDCELYANQHQGIDYTDEKEKAAIELIFDNALSGLSKDDRSLPQVAAIQALVRRGIGVHHGGLLPILKEVVEILFGEGYIKILCATETFAMGLNMPARTVLFTATMKFDGTVMRLVSPGEYIQMSGRAGRRGKDDRGTVILMLDDKISAQAAKNLLCGSADPLNSAFHLTYTMVLNLLLVEDINPETMLERSFFQFQNYLKFPVLDKEVDQLQKELQEMTPTEDAAEGGPDLANLQTYVDLCDAIESLERQKWALVTKASNVLQFLQCGRVMRVTRDDGSEFGWGICLGPRRLRSAGKLVEMVVDCLLRVKSAPQPTDEAKDKPATQQSVRLDKLDPHEPLDSDGDFDALVCQASLSAISGLSSVCLRVGQMLNDTQADKNAPEGKRAAQVRRQSAAVRRNMWQAIERACAKLPSGELPLLDPVVDMRLKDAALLRCAGDLERFRQRLALSPIHGRTDRDRLVEQHQRRACKSQQLAEARGRLERCEALLQMEELRARKRMLRRVAFCTDSDAITLKGRIACELTSGDELILTELLLDGLFSQLTPEQCAAVLSVFVCDSGESRKPPKLRPDMQRALNTIKAKARHISRLAAECQVSDLADQARQRHGAVTKPSVRVVSSETQDDGSYEDRFCGDLMEVVRAWAGGVSFREVAEMTDLYEGSIIRSMRRLEELLREMHSAAKVAGDSDLENKFSRSIALIKRDIVFAASLYL